MDGWSDGHDESNELFAILRTRFKKNAEWRVKGKKQKFKKNSSRPRMKIKQSTTWQEIQTFGKIPILTNTSRPDYNKVQAATGSA